MQQSNADLAAIDACTVVVTVAVGVEGPAALLTRIRFDIYQSPLPLQCLQSIVVL